MGQKVFSGDLEITGTLTNNGEPVGGKQGYTMTIQQPESGWPSCRLLYTYVDSSGKVSTWVFNGTESAKTVNNVVSIAADQDASKGRVKYVSHGNNGYGLFQQNPTNVLAEGDYLTVNKDYILHSDITVKIVASNQRVFTIVENGKSYQCRLDPESDIYYWSRFIASDNNYLNLRLDASDKVVTAYGEHIVDSNGVQVGKITNIVNNATYYVGSVS